MTPRARPTPPEPRADKRCDAVSCGAIFIPKVHWQLFCSDRCGRAARLERFWLKKLRAKLSSPTKTTTKGDRA